MKTGLIARIFTFLFLLTITANVFADLPVKRVLTLTTASHIANMAEMEANRRKATVVIAVVDDGGYPIVLKRLDDTQVASVDVAIAKARTAAIFRRPSKVFEDQVREGRVAALALPGAAALQGGVPIIYDGIVIGAIGVSGNTPQEDEDIAKVGADSINGLHAATAKVTYLPASDVSKSFIKGAPLLEVENYKVHASHRDEPGIAEIHECDTDVIYVLEGNATFVTGGNTTDAKLFGPEEIRGNEIVDGQTQQLSKGDVMIVPNGVPHWFKETTSPFNYYIVKVRSKESCSK